MTMSLEELGKQRILLLDGAMGSLLQRAHLPSEAFLSPATGKPEESCGELLNLHRPDVVRNIHQAYLDAGADIIETNTFNANRISLGEYGLEKWVRDLNLAACRIATEARGGRDAFIAGDIGPTKESLSLATNVDDPAWRSRDFDSFVQVYEQQASALLEGGVDLFLVETVFDTLVAKAAVKGCQRAMRLAGKTVPVMVSVTFSDQSGRMLCGQDLGAMVASFSEYPLFSLGINCSTGARAMAEKAKELAAISPFRVSIHPNAGIPDEDGNYPDGPQKWSGELRDVIESGEVSIVGGCCGTTPEHIRALKAIATGVKPHAKGKETDSLVLSSLESRTVRPGVLFVVGERCNVAGSRKFATMVAEHRWDEALSIARAQVKAGADALDICMDAPMLDARSAMVTFLRVLQSDPLASRVPVMVDSSDFSVIERAMEEIQGRCIVNSISLKEGEKPFLERARLIHSYGHAMVVMLFDEKGQADTYERKTACAKRSYDLLASIGIPPYDIIFDPNVLAVATGISAHDSYARDCIRATGWIHQNLPGTLVSGGVSNLSFAFRGNNRIRSAMHAIFLDLAKPDMAIVNPSSDRDVAHIPAYIRFVVGRALAEGTEEGREALVSLAESTRDLAAPKPAGTKDTIPVSPKEELVEAVLQGDDSRLSLLLEALSGEDPLSLVEGPLMQGMEQVGKRFGKGEMFLPQVVRSARTMRRAVEILQPRIQQSLHHGPDGPRKPVVVLATVRGDVHDIGKNICALVLSCNHFEVHDLGVMVEAATIWRKARQLHADLIGLSGLITPSLREIEKTISYLARQGSKIPVFVGGATTSDRHTALYLAPLSLAPVVHTGDASHMVLAALRATGKERALFFKEMEDRYARIRKEERLRMAPAPVDDPLALRSQKRSGNAAHYGIWTRNAWNPEEMEASINWKELVAAMRIPLASPEADRAVADAKRMFEDSMFQQSLRKGCRAVWGLFPASSDRRTVTVGSKRFHFLRNERSGLCLADFVAPIDDTVGAFVVTSEMAPVAETDSYRKVLAQLLYDRVAEALAVLVQKEMEGRWEGEGTVIRPAPGYPTWPDHTEKLTLFSLLDATGRTGVELTSSLAMRPAASVCALVLKAPDSCYFGVGAVSDRQLEQYAKCKGVSLAKLKPFLSGANP